MPEVLEVSTGRLRAKAIEGTSAHLAMHDKLAAARAVGLGLRAFHEAVPVAGCPWV